MAPLGLAGMIRDTLENEGVLCRSAPLCVLCGQEGSTVYAGLRDRLFGAPGVWSIRWCGSCGLAWLDPRPVPQDIVKLYRAYYTHSPDTAGDGLVNRLKQTVKRGVLISWLGYQPRDGAGFARVIGMVAGLIPAVRDAVECSVMCLPAGRVGRLLDVGCGSGVFLTRMRDLGWDVCGVEPDPEAARRARLQGLEVHQALVEEAELPSAVFDAVTMNHVIEHVVSPLAAWRACARVLRPGGRLVAVTPNWHSLLHRRFGASWRGLEPPRHLWLFTPQSLARCVERAGLRVEHTRTSARLATWIWRVSWRIEREGKAPDSMLSSGRVGGRLQGVWAQIREEVARHYAPVGEEIVLVGTKP